MTLLIESWISRGLKQCYWLMYGSSALPLVSQEYSYYHWRDAPLKLDGKAVKQCTQQLQCCSVSDPLWQCSGSMLTPVRNNIILQCFDTFVLVAGRTSSLGNALSQPLPNI